MILWTAPCWVGVQALYDAEPAILSVLSVLSVVKNTIAFSPRIAQITRMNCKGHKKVVQCLRKSMFSRFRPMRDRQTNLQLGAVQLCISQMGQEAILQAVTRFDEYASFGASAICFSGRANCRLYPEWCVLRVVLCQLSIWGFVIPAQAGIQTVAVDSRLRGNDGNPQVLILTKQ